MAHVVRTLQTSLGDDPFSPSYATPSALQKLLDAGALGQKTGAGFYKKVGKDILRFDCPTAILRPGWGRTRRVEASSRSRRPAAHVLHDRRMPGKFVGEPREGSTTRRAPVDIAERARRRTGERWGSAPGGPSSSGSRRRKQVAGWVKDDIDAGRESRPRRAAGVSKAVPRRRRAPDRRSGAVGRCIRAARTLPVTAAAFREASSARVGASTRERHRSPTARRRQYRTAEGAPPY